MPKCLKILIYYDNRLKGIFLLEDLIVGAKYYQLICVHIHFEAKIFYPHRDVI